MGNPWTRRKSVSLVMKSAQPARKGRRGVEGVGRLQARRSANARGVLPHLACGRHELHFRRGEHGTKGGFQFRMALSQRSDQSFCTMTISLHTTVQLPCLRLPPRGSQQGEVRLIALYAIDDG